VGSRVIDQDEAHPATVPGVVDRGAAVATYAPAVSSPGGSPRALAAAARAARTTPDVVVMRLQGELGNQLFQFAVGTAITRRLGCPLRFDVAHHAPTLSQCIGDAFVLASDADLLRVAELRTSPVEQWVRSLQLRAWLPLRRRRHRPERHIHSPDTFGHDPRLDELVAPCFVRGYFQSVGLFADVLDDVVETVLGELGEAPSPPEASDLAVPEVVGLHFRRGDYLPRGWELSMDYYDAALGRVDEQLGSVCLRVFADDEVFGQLMVEHLEAQGRRAELATDPGIHAHPAVDALISLARCDHLVIANSTFSWWAAALGDRLRRDRLRLVLTPARWRQDRPPPDLVLPGWQAVET
jgi:Glycosyl transferase family 11